MDWRRGNASNDAWLALWSGTVPLVYRAARSGMAEGVYDARKPA